MAIAVAVGLLSRLGLEAPGAVPYTFDPAFHHRMVERQLEAGLGPLDPPQLHPAGCRPAELQPTGLYRAAAIFVRLGTPLGLSATGGTQLFNALVGALVCIPVFVLGRRVWSSTGAGFLAAACVAIVPAHAARTLSFHFRFDALGSLWIAAALAAIAASLAARSRRSAWGAAVVAALATAFALDVWRAGVALVTLEAAALSFLLLSPDARRVRPVAVMLLLAVLASGFMPYYQAKSFLVSRVGLVGLALLALVALASGVRASSAGRRFAVLALVLGIPLALSQLVPAAPYDLEEGAAGRALATALGLAEPGPDTRLYASVAELQPPGGSIVRGERVLSAITLLVLAALAASRGALRKRARLDVVFLLLIGGGLLLSTLLFERGKVFLAIPASVFAGGAAAWVEKGPAWRRVAAALAALAALAVAAGDTARVRAASVARVDADLIATCEWIDANLPADAALFCEWPLGYIVQSYGRRPTFVDGHFELAEMRERIGALDRALLSPEEDDLFTLADRYRITHFLYDAERWGQPYLRAGIGQLDGRRMQLPAARRGDTIARLEHAPESLERLTPVYRRGSYAVVAIGAPREPASLPATR